MLDLATITLPSRLRHAAAACGLLDKYLNGILSDDDFVGRRGKLKLTIEKGTKGYPDKNVVADYVCSGLKGEDTGKSGSGAASEPGEITFRI